MKTRTITKAWLIKQEACSGPGEAIEAWEREKDHGTIATLKRLIRRNQLDWANWLITRDGILTKSQRQNYANYAVEKAIRLSLRYYKNPDYVQWAKKWLDGEDRSADAAYAAADAAAYAAYAAAYAAADASYAAYAAYAAGAAAYAAGAANAAAGAANAAAYAAAGAADAAAYAAGAANAAAGAANAAAYAAYAAAYAAGAANAAAYAAANAAAYAAANAMKKKILRYGMRILQDGPGG